MSEDRRIRPADNGTESKNQAGELSATILPEQKRVLIGATVEKPLDASLWDLVQGRIGLHDLTPALAGFWTLGYSAGIASCRARIDRLEQEADRLYVQAFNPADRAKLIRDRMDAAAENYWQEFVANGGVL